MLAVAAEGVLRQLCLVHLVLRVTKVPLDRFSLRVTVSLSLSLSCALAVAVNVSWIVPYQGKYVNPVVTVEL